MRPAKLACRVRLLSTGHGRRPDRADALSVGIAGPTLPGSRQPPRCDLASRRGTWLSPNNVRRQWREGRVDTDLAWVTPHTTRKTAATLNKEETDTKSAAAQLGHSSEEVTDTYYIAKPDCRHPGWTLETLTNGQAALRHAST
ncbi:tyrosine-type recombinase/integrase [Micromonospora taraxaci]|uniref:tyrosine-type recombinase/integrase n=1 Tax=Micromonospora taraxaci TaxID=1316803 RepID=UPI0033E5D484